MNEFEAEVKVANNIQYMDGQEILVEIFDEGAGEDQVFNTDSISMAWSHVENFIPGTCPWHSPFELLMDMQHALDAWNHKDPGAQIHALQNMGQWDDDTTRRAGYKEITTLGDGVAVLRDEWVVLQPNQVTVKDEQARLMCRIQYTNPMKACGA